MPTKRDDYIRHIDECRAKAALAPTHEISALWETIANSYRFLVEREDRLAREHRANGISFFDWLSESAEGSRDTLTLYDQTSR